MKKSSHRLKYSGLTAEESHEKGSKNVKNLNVVKVDPQRRKLGRLEELNQMIEERIKNMMYKPEVAGTKESSMYPSWHKDVKRVNDRYSKASPSRDKHVKMLSETEISSSFSPTLKTNLELSEFRFEEVLGLCKANLETVQLREQLPQSAKLDILQKASPYRSINSFNTTNVSMLLPEPSGPNSSNYHLPKRKSSSGEKRIRNHLQKKPSQSLESPKQRINQILKGHAQKLSVHSIQSGNEGETPKLDKPGSSKENESKYQKVIEIQKRNEHEEPVKPETETGQGEKEQKQVSYGDCTGNRELKSLAVLTLDKGRGSHDAGILDKGPPTSAPVRTPSEVILLSSMIGSMAKHGVREAINVKEDRKVSDQAIKTKCSKSAELKDLVTQAIKDRKIFCIFDNHWYIVRPVREELLSRGWLEVIPDRRLIPRKKPPPAGPTLDRLSSADYGIEAILTAKEAFADDVTDLIKYPPLKIPDRCKMQRKYSDESLKETVSEFRIVPPSAEKKKNNSDIREFVTKCQSDQQQNVKPNETTKDKKRKISKHGLCMQEDSKNPPSAVPRNAQHALEDQTSHLGSERGEKSEEKAKSVVMDASKDTKFSLTETESKMASKIIQSSNAKINFMWLSIKPGMHLKCFNYSPEIVNKFQKTTFCTKIGLWSHLNNIQWHAHEVTFPAKSPRMYNTGEADDLQAFFQDFQMTACIGILKWLSETFFSKGIKGVQKKKGKVPVKAFEFAIRQCERYIRFRENEDLNALEEPKVMQEEWNTFLQWFYIITNDHGKVQETSNAQITVIYTKAVEILRAMKRYWPEIDVDGRLNIWIMKPYCASCGRGIFMTNNVYYIGQHSKYIVQKYIERPFLIYNTKFDIRQWFMITKLIPLEIWMYKECYLRFCTQPFALRNLHESVHLSNNSVQRKYVNQRDPNLPDQNMWDSNTFQQYLKTVGQPNAWNEIIYPGMRDAIISTMLSAQDTFDSQRRSWFEVYGADFMISANLKDGPWLIEINENPAMDPSTKVTARLCPQMIRDVIKVVVDKRANKNALTGQWELVYRQNYSPSFGTLDVDVKGKRVARIPQSIKTGYSNSFVPSPYFLAKKEINENDQDTKKKYEVVKSFNDKSGDLDPNGEVKKQSAWKTRGRARLLKETSTSVLGKSQGHTGEKNSKLKKEVNCFLISYVGAHSQNINEVIQERRT